MRILACLYLLLSFLILFPQDILAQHSVARKWNEVLLEAIRTDFARPTVHARNLFHSSVAMYDIWAVFEDGAETYFLGKNLHSFPLPFEDFPYTGDIQEAREEAMSFAMARLIRHRFQNSPGAEETMDRVDSLMTALGYDINDISVAYQNGNPSALGNYVGQGLINYGRTDGSNEEEDYRNEYYVPLNFPMDPNDQGNPFITDPNRWQPLTFQIFIDQSGNPIPGDVPPFLSPEWGKVLPFALNRSDLTLYEKFGTDFYVYHDPGPPPYLPTDRENNDYTDYQWGFEIVALWSSHLDPSDGVMWDISPGALGNTNIDEFPQTIEDLPNFYKELEGGDIGTGHALNPATGQPYEPQMVPRGDYARVLAEFWADGPDSETPPGHWFTILNYVSDHPDLVKRFEGQGDILDDLEWDVKTYLTLGGAMHDAAISAWGIKGYYDYVRPVSALRLMIARGQASDPNDENYDPNGIELTPGLVELVRAGDPLAGIQQQNIGKIKIKAWRGPDFIIDPDTSVAGVGWILGENWWPYQRPSFVTPNFAGYVSGHSTYSRAASEVLTMFTGDPFFPGGMGEFVARQNEFLVFEDGPSQDIILQWATYRDASDQTSLSRIWGGIHPPADDIPGRLIGEKVGVDAFTKAKNLFQGVENPALDNPDQFAYPNPVRSGSFLYVAIDQEAPEIEAELIAADGRRVLYQNLPVAGNFVYLELDLARVAPGVYFLKLKGEGIDKTEKIQVY
ncbi:MAG: T9SS type A sorting domain-containing protein [Bacteroidia bacterium]|nr:T9SS type A sorting domain-containing protein [Bacteroidia bacterium]